MNIQQILNSVLADGKEFAVEGKEQLEDVIGLPVEGEERQAALDNMTKGAAAAGALALILGTKSGRKLATTILKLGGIAAISTAAYSAINKYANQKGLGDNIGTPVAELTGSDAEFRKKSLVRAMIGAAKADGDVTHEERKKILAEIELLQLTQNDVAWVKAMYEEEITPMIVAQGADSLGSSSELYMATRAIIGPTNDKNSSYILDLIAALKLDEEIVSLLNNELDGITQNSV